MNAVAPPARSFAGTTLEEARERAHLPDLGVDAGRQLADRKPHVAANVEDADLDRPDVLLDRLHELDLD